MICPATNNEIDGEYCDGDCINCPWMKVNKEDSMDSVEVKE